MNPATAMLFEKIKTYLYPYGDLVCKPLFEGHALSCRGVTFGMLVREEIYLCCCQPGKLSAQYQTQLLTVTRLGKPVVLNYYHISQSLLEEPELFLRLAEESLSYAAEKTPAARRHWYGK